MKKAMILIEQRLAVSASGEALSGAEATDVVEPLAVQVLQIHDSILVECARDNAEDVGEIMRSAMETIAPDLGIRLDVDVSIGENWGQV